MSDDDIGQLLFVMALHLETTQGIARHRFEFRRPLFCILLHLLRRSHSREAHRESNDEGCKSNSVRHGKHPSDGEVSNP